MSTILIIDDDDQFRRMLRLTLTSMGHTVSEASDGRQGLKLYAAEPPDIVLTDIVMPEQDGIGTILELRQIEPGVRIVAMSGGGRIGTIDYLRVARQLGVKSVLAKPFTPDAVADAIAFALA